MNTEPQHEIAGAACPPDPDSAAAQPGWTLRRRLAQALIVPVIVLLAIFWKPVAATWYRRQAAGQLESAQLLAAASSAHTAVQLQPDDIASLRLLLSAQRQSEQLQKASETLQKLATLKPDPLLLQMEQTLLQARVGDPATQESLLAPMLASDDLSTVDVSDAFVIYYRAFARLDAAELLLSAWEADHPTDYRIAAHRGLLAQMKMDVPAAVTGFQHAVERGDPRAATRLHLGRCLLEVRDVPAAVEILKQAAQIRADDPSIRLALAEALLQSNDETGAARETHVALSLDPASWEADLLLARIENSRERYREALVQTERILGDWPADRDALHNQAAALTGLGRQAEAAVAFAGWKAADERVLELEALLRQLQHEPANEDVRTRAGLLMMAHFSRASAVELLEAVLRANPDSKAARDCLDDYLARRQRRLERSSVERQAAVPE